MRLAPNNTGKVPVEVLSLFGPQGERDARPRPPCGPLVARPRGQRTADSGMQGDGGSRVRELRRPPVLPDLDTMPDS
jgi:hypothetical protein